MNAPDPPYWTPNLCFEVLWTVSLLHESRCKTNRTAAINAAVRATKSRRNFSQWKHPMHPHLTPNSCFGVPQTILLLHESWCKTGRTGAINAQVCATKSCLNFFATNGCDPPHCTPNLCLGRIGPFRYYTKVGAKWAELVQLMHKFVQRSCVGIFRNKRNLSTPLDPKLMF
jgi:hypothetical protein